MNKKTILKILTLFLSVVLVSLITGLSKTYAVEYDFSEYWPEYDGVYFIRNVKSGKYMDLFGTPSNNANVGLWHGNKGTNQQWIVKRSNAYPNGTHVFEIHSVANPNYVLTIW